MTDTEGRSGNGPVALADPVEVAALPVILNNAYFELTGVNLRCLVNHLEVIPENKPETVTTFCGEVDYPGVTKWGLKVTFQQSFDAGAVYDTLAAARAAFEADGTLADFKARPYASRPVGPGNPEISGSAVPQPFPLIVGDAGKASEVAIEWTCLDEPTVSTVAGP